MNNKKYRSIQLFIKRLQYEKNAAFNTVIAYHHDLLEFGRFLNRDIDNAQDYEVKAYLMSLDQHSGRIPLSRQSIARRISCLRMFYKDLIRMELRHDNPMKDIKSPKFSRKLPNVVSEEELQKLFRKLTQTDSDDFREIFKKIRDLMIFEILYSCGLRATELCRLKISHVYLDEEIVRIIGKGNKERLIPIGSHMKSLLQIYLPVRHRFLEGVECEYLITSKFKKNVSRMFIWKVLKHYSSDSEITELSPHMLRHAFASHMLWHGADLRLIQELLGHSDLSTTEIYTHVQKSHLVETMNDCHPLSS